MIKGKSTSMEEHANENIQKMKHPCQDAFSDRLCEPRYQGKSQSDV